MRTVVKDILTIDEGWILHQVNCLGVMGAGLALQIANKWPQVFSEYHTFCQKHHPTTLLGQCTWTKVADKIHVVNLFGQLAYGAGRQTQYDALAKAIDRFYKEAPIRSQPVFAPVGIGCGLAGGNWDVVKAMFFGRTITFCRRPS